MHPAISVIFFTVVSGVGLGLLFLLGLGLAVPAHPMAPFLFCAAAIGLASAGLLASTFHLGRPERAWRALSQWRSSWLSREGVLAFITLFAFGIYSLFWILSDTRIVWLGALSAIFALATIIATGMIYTQLKTVPAWHTWLTPASYLAFALASGLVAASAFGGTARILPLPMLALATILAAWLLKWAWWRNAATGFAQTGSDSGTATGLGYLGKVRMLESPHSGDNYLTREMVHRIGRKHANKLRRIAVFFGGILPILASALAVIMGSSMFVMPVALISIIIGLFVERWLFFAEAKHSVSLYYDRG
jgi:sulfite dehydrogenase (quinone) subunit SoeC